MATLKVRNSQNSILDAFPLPIPLIRHKLSSFSQTPYLLCNWLDSDELCYETEEHIYLCLAVYADRSILKEVQKVRNCSFNLLTHSLLQINTQTVTNYIRRMVEL